MPSAGVLLAPGTGRASQGGFGGRKIDLHRHSLILFISTSHMHCKTRIILSSLPFPHLDILSSAMGTYGHIYTIHSHERRKGQGLHRKRRRWHNRSIIQHSCKGHCYGCGHWHLNWLQCWLCRLRGGLHTRLVLLVLLRWGVDHAVAGFLEAADDHGPHHGSILRRVPRAR